MAKILIIDDDPDIRDFLTRTLEHAGHEVQEAANGAIGISQCCATPPDLLITDMMMPEQNGLDVITTIKHDWPHVKIIAISGGSRELHYMYLIAAMDMHADLTLTKPFGQAEILKAVEALLPTVVT